MKDAGISIIGMKENFDMFVFNVSLALFPFINITSPCQPLI